MSSNSVLENLRRQWSQYNSPPTKPGMPKPQIHRPYKVEPKPEILKSIFNSECYGCHEAVVFNTIWWDDFRNCYIPLEPNSMLEHHCKKTYMRNNKLQSQIFHTF